MLLLMVLLSSSKVLADSGTSFEDFRRRKAVAAVFALDPPATVWRRTVEGQVNLLGSSDQKVTMGLTPSESSGDRELIVEFRVPLWFSEWVSPPEFLTLEQLVIHGRYPSVGRRRLSLTGWQRFQAFTRSHLGLSFGVLFAVFVTGWGLSRRRKRVSRQVDSLLVGEFRLRKKIGEGAMGEVFEAVSGDGQEGAVKLLRPLLSESLEFKTQFDRELATYAKLSHPGLPKLFGYGYASDGRSFMATELMRGKTLKEQLPAPLYQRQVLALDILEKVGAVLDYLHSLNIVHQDVKPSNIFLARNGDVKLLDLGIARSLESGESEFSTAGTPAYMAPEQFEGKARLASDQYALGLVLYEVLVGRRPWKETDPKVLAHLRGRGEIPKSKLSEKVEQVLTRLLCPDPEKRYPSLKDALESLKLALQR